MQNCKIIKQNLEVLENHNDLVLVYGHFTTIHPGHIRYLENAAKKGNKLIIALKQDEKIKGKSRYVFSQEERGNSLAALSIVDYVLFLKDDNFVDVIKSIKPNFLILGKEFEKTEEKNLSEAIFEIKKLGGKVLYDAGDINYSSSELLNGSLNNLFEERKSQFLKACKKQKITLEKILNSISKWKSSKIIVIGDSIIDQYAACEAIGMSAEAPVVVVKELKNKNFIGGAAIVAAHIASLGAQCEFISVTGNDSEKEFLSKELKRYGIGLNLIIDNIRPTTFKKRYVVDNQKLFRVSKFEDHSINQFLENKIIDKLEKLAPNSHSIVISDFVYGVITDNIIKKVKSLAKKYNLKIFGDLQCSSQIGQITKFKEFSMLCPNEKEARIAINEKELGLEAISQKLIKVTKTEKLLMKLGSKGFIVYDRDELGNLFSQYFPALSVNPLDVTGAGDSVLAAMAVGISCDQSTMITSAVATFMAAISVEQMGNTPINEGAIIKKLQEFFNVY